MERCAAVLHLAPGPSIWCELDRGHEGEHEAEGATWTDAVLSQDFDTDRPE